MDRLYLWIGFGVIVAGILIFDLAVLSKRKRALRLRQTLIIVGVYMLIAVLFGMAIVMSVGTDAGLQYFTAYLLEMSLSFDNVFVWVVIFKQLQVPPNEQDNVLFWGILGAMAFRAAFIFAGAALIELFDWVLYLFGAIAIFSGARLLRANRQPEHDVTGNRLFHFLHRHMRVTDDYRNGQFIVRRQGLLCATPLLVALVIIETSDIVFALDSVPAILGVTRDRLVVYTSNILAVLGLRALYFAIAGLVEHLRYLRYGLSLLLVLIGLKMIASEFVEIPIWLTLGATISILAGTIGLSLMSRQSSRREQPANRP